MKARLFLIAAAAIAAITSCQQEEILIDLIPSQTSLEFGAEGGTQTIDISEAETELVATVSEGCDWCTVKVNAVKVVVSAALNTNREDRTATVTISSTGANDLTINVSQNALVANLDNISDEIEAPAAGGEFSLGTFDSNIEPTVEIVGADWITEYKISGNEVILVAEENLYTSREDNILETREATVKVSISDVLKDVKISQAPNVTMKISHIIIEPNPVVPQYQQMRYSFELLGATNDFRFKHLKADQYEELGDNPEEKMLAILMNPTKEDKVKDKAYFDDMADRGGSVSFPGIPNTSTHSFWLAMYNDPVSGKTYYGELVEYIVDVPPFN